jgi:hypothetical protein
VTATLGREEGHGGSRTDRRSSHSKIAKWLWHSPENGFQTHRRSQSLVTDAMALPTINRNTALSGDGNGGDGNGESVML